MCAEDIMTDECDKGALVVLCDMFYWQFFRVFCRMVRKLVAQLCCARSGRQSRGRYSISGCGKHDFRFVDLWGCFCIWRKYGKIVCESRNMSSYYGEHFHNNWYLRYKNSSLSRKLLYNTYVFWFGWVSQSINNIIIINVFYLFDVIGFFFEY